MLQTHLPHLIHQTHDFIDEVDLCLKHTEVIANFNTKISDFPVSMCCCCEHLHQGKSVSKIALDTNLDNSVWLALIAYIQCRNPSAENTILYMCNYCKPLVCKGIMPPKCILNGLEIILVPKELKQVIRVKNSWGCHPTHSNHLQSIGVQVHS